MPFRVNCPNCKTAYSISEDSLGKKLLCKKCQKPFAVGNAKVPPASAAAPAAPGRTTADIQPRPTAKTPPRREAVAAEVPPMPPQGKSRRLVPLIVAGVLVVAVAVAAGVGGAIYFLKPSDKAPVAVNVGPSSAPKTPPASQPPVANPTKKTDSSQPSTAPANPSSTPATPPTGETPVPPTRDTPPIPATPPSIPASTTPATAAVQVDPTRLKIPNARLAKYEPEQKRWVYSFRNAVRATNGLFSIDVLPSGTATDRDAYAAKLLQKDSLEPGRQFTEVTEKGDLPDGFFLKGAVKNQASPKPEFGFVIVRKVNGAVLRCRNGIVANRPVSDDELRQTMLDIFKQVTVRTTTLLPLPPPSGSVMLRDNVTLVVSHAETANLIYFDTVAEREVKRVEVEFQPGELVVQGDTLFAAAKGSALVHALDAATGKAKKEYNLGGDAIVHLACHPRKGLLYASTTNFALVSLDPLSGVVTKVKGLGQFLAVSPDGKYLYTGVQPPDRDEIEIIFRRDGSMHIYSDMWGRRAMLMKYEVDGPNLRFVAGQNNAAVNGWWMHLTPDGKRLLMVGGGGWRPPKEGGTDGGYFTAVYSTDNLKSIVQRIPFSGLNTIFHPVLNLGAANSYGMNVTLFNGKSLVKRTAIELNNEREQRPLVLAFGAKGRKLILWNGNNVQKEQGLHFLPLPLKPEEEATLSKAAEQPEPVEPPPPPAEKSEKPAPADGQAP